MPVEINELVVRVVVDPAADPATPSAVDATPRGRAREELVQQCVEAVLDALRAMKER